MSKLRGSGKWRSDMPARTNTGSSIRGKSISAPIPWTDDDEFPIRTPGAGIATPVGRDSIEKQHRPRGSTPTRPERLTPPRGFAVSDVVELATAARSTPVSSDKSQESVPHRANQPSTLRTSMGSIPTGAGTKPQRKKSTLKSVLGRLFGKKRKSSTSSDAQQTSSTLRAEQHRSDPTALNRNRPNTPSQKRSASLPINEFNRALRSHSVVLEEFPVEDGAESTNRQSIQADGHTRPRRATTPSRLWEPSRPLAYADWTGLSPRPASSHARGSRVIIDAEAEAVGIAITSGSHPNRRSRSLGELRGAFTVNTVIRRRSDEIRYWRDSYVGVLSPMSSNRADAEEDPIIMDEPELPHELEANEQPQPFNFGPLGEMAGMKITQAASLETRVLQLEERMSKMEKSISRIHHALAGTHIQLQDPPKGGSRRGRPSSGARSVAEKSEVSLPRHQAYFEQQRPESRPRGSQKRSSSYGSSRPTTMSTNHSHQPSFENFLPPILPPIERELQNTQIAARPLSTSTTIRGIPSSSPTMPKDGVLTSEHYNTLTNIIITEQKARQSLEDVVRILQRQLKASINASSVSHPSDINETRAVQLDMGRDNISDEEERGGTEVFQTPREESGQFGDDIFGQLVRNSEEVKVPPRALSLSQMTLGKGVQQSVQF